MPRQCGAVRNEYGDFYNSGLGFDPHWQYIL
jgi:hypothetical protein